jgi:PAS domain S-box-containing protein
MMEKQFSQIPFRTILLVSFLLSALPMLAVAVFPAQLNIVLTPASYVVLHIIAEFFSIMVSLSIFGVGWFTFDQSKDRHALFLSATFLGIGLLDFMHTLTNAAMPAFITPNSPNRSTQFWIAARLFEAIAFLVSAFIYRNTDNRLLSKRSLMATALLIPGIMVLCVYCYQTDVPSTFSSESGLTPFKIYSEYLVIVFLCAAFVAYWRRRAKTSDQPIAFYLAAFIFSTFSELSLAIYTKAFDTYNILGHVYKVVAFALMYRAIFIASVKAPYEELAGEKRIRHLASFPQLNPNPILEVDLTGKVIFSNPAAHKILEDLGIDKEDFKVFLPVDMQAITSSWDRKNELSFYRVLTIKDRIFGSHIYLNPQFSAARIYAYDITAHKRGEEALRASEERLTLAQEAAKIGTWEWNLETNENTWSKETWTLYGLDPRGAEPSYETWKNTIHPDDREKTEQTVREAARTGNAFETEWRVRHSGRTIRWLMSRGHPISDTAGAVVKYIGIVMDISERKQAQEMLITLNKDLENRVFQRTRFYSVLASVNIAIVRQHDQHALFNEVCRIIVETGGFKLAWVGLVDPATREVRPAASCGAVAYLDGIRIIASDIPEGRGPTGMAIIEGRHITNLDFEKDEKMKPWRERARTHGIRSSSAFPLRAGNQVVGALTIYSEQPRFFNVDEVALLLSLSENLSFAIAAFEVEKDRRAAVDALKALNEDLELRVARRTAELEFSNKELEAFIYSISHDLRAPLRHISGFTRIIAEDYADKFDEQGKEHLARIHNGAERMAHLIEDLLRLSRISRQDMERENVDMSAMATALVAEFREADPDSNREVVIKEQISAAADRRLIKLALQNLIDNAWKFTSKTQNARIEFDAFQQEEKTVYRFRDNGVGFDSAYSDKMFLPFHRLHTESEFEGSGIGLAIVERVIQRHGGRIWAEGEPGKGAAIYFTLN